MSNRLDALRTGRVRHVGEMRSILDTAENENRQLTGEEQATLERLEEAIRGTDREIDLRTRIDAPGPEPELERTTTSDPVSTDEYRDAFIGYLKTGRMETRAQGVATDAAGGYAVPAGFRVYLRERMMEVSAMRDAVTVINTDSGGPIEWPTVDETGVTGVILSENTQVAEQDVTLGTATLDAYKYSSKMVRISSELLQDSAVDIDAYVARALGERVARITNTHFTVGTGTAQPDGIAVGATTGVTTAAGATTTFTGDNLIDLIHSVDPAYRANGRFMMRDATLAIARRLKDANGQYLWQPGLTAGVPDSMLGYPVVINQDMPAAAAGAVSVLFGDFRAAYVVREVAGFRVLRLTERFADFDQIALLGFLRTDGTKQDTNAYRALVHAAA